MALNFPPNPSDKAIYIDPSSGLKYIFNGSIGGWETAIQPPVITNTDDEPTLQMEGFLWWNHPDRMLYVYKGGDWIPIMRAGGSGSLGVPVVCAPAPPENAFEGWLWWDSIGGNLYVYYCDEPAYDVEGATGTCQWVITNTGESGGQGAEALAIVSDIEPTNPQDGQMWLNNGTDVLYVYDAESGMWKQAVQGSGGGGSGGGGSMTGSSPIVVSGNNISINKASTTRDGSVRFAKSSDSNDDNRDDVAISPSYAKNKFSTLIPDATTSAKGIVRLAADLSDTDGVVTAGTLLQDKDNAGFSNPVGTVIMFASQQPPVGYLACNGDTIPNGTGNIQGVTADFSALYAVLGTSYSTNAMVKLPDMRGNFSKGYDSGNFGDYESVRFNNGTETRISSVTFSYCIKY